MSAMHDIPAHWQRVRLLDVCEKITQGPNPKYDKFGTPSFRVLKTKDLYDDEIHYSAADTVSDFVFKSHSKAELFPGDILLAIVGQGSINKCNVFKRLPGCRFIFTRALGLVRPRTTVVEPHFLKYFLQSDLGKSMIDAGIGGTSGQQVVTTTHLKGLRIPLPPLEEQQRIVAAVDEAFAAIATAAANSEKNLANARELFDATVREAFARPSPLWDLLTLKEAALDFGRGKSKHRPRNDPQLYGGEYPFIQTGDVRNCEHVIMEYSQSYSAAGLAQSKLWPMGTICITIAANIAETGILNFDACFPDSVIGMVVDPATTSNSYVEYLLQSLKSALQAKGKGSAQANINLATFENERFPFPPKDVQVDIVARLGALSQQVQAMEAVYAGKLQALAALKQSLLRKAFSGELAVAARELVPA